MRILKNLKNCDFYSEVDTELRMVQLYYKNNPCQTYANYAIIITKACHIFRNYSSAISSNSENSAEDWIFKKPTKQKITILNIYCFWIAFLLFKAEQN